MGYTVNEIGLFATPSGGAEYLAFYESTAAGSIFEKTAGSVILRRLRLTATGAQLTNATFNVGLTAPQATEELAGVSELADNPEADADEADASATRVITVAKWWRMFTGARIVARLEALLGNNKLNISATRGDVPADRIPRLPVSKVRIYSGTDDVANQTVVGTQANPAQAGDIYAQREA